MGEPDHPAADIVATLVERLGLPRSLREVNIKADSIGEIAERALRYEAVKMNPRPIRRADDVREILDLAW